MSRVVFVGIDGGGSSTECCLADEQGNLLGTGLAGGSNLTSSGEEVVLEALEAALRAAGLRGDDHVPVAVFGLSGALPGEANPRLEALARRVLPQAETLRVINDAVNALAGAFGLEAGICVNAGTGAIGIGRDPQGRLAFASGWGPLLGDEGSGYWIGLHGLNAAVKALDRRGPPTRLLDCLVAELQAPDLQQAALSLYSRPDQRKAISGLCPAVLACAAEGDKPAAAIVQEAAHELALTALAVAGKLVLVDVPLQVAPAGNVLLKGMLLAQRFTREIERLLPQAQVVAPRFRPAFGSLLLAFQAAQTPLGGVMEALGKMDR